MTLSRLSTSLEGIRILDLTRNIAGPVATMFAAEMGADVIKVEPPGGDEMRTWPPFVDGESVYFLSCNRGKRSIALDLKKPEDKEILRQLVDSADVVVENYRPGTLEKLGVGYENFKAEKPRLVWVSVTGYGRTGPGAGAPAYDSMIQAFTGMMGITGEPNGGPVRSGGSPIDVATAYLAWGSIMTGIRTVEKTGEGILLEVSLMESALGFMHAYLQGALVDLPLPARMGSETMGMYPMGVFKTTDGEHCLVQVSNELQWARFCSLIGADQLFSDSRFATNPLRVKNRDELRPLIQAYIIQKPAAQWERELLAVGVPASHVKPLQKVAVDPQLKARNMVKETTLPSGRQIPTWGVPIKADEVMASRSLKVPAKDQHREEILAQLRAQQ
ncbi:MAG: CaiB/BaiF CoA transferase family protein [Hydrogenophaga sp.]|uniref:CaiB/BaiF CoA transferase family protein n=1 Tax=Hydrogenophaga sp. TaxID=1904254 RepID=UPI004036E3DB